MDAEAPTPDPQMDDAGAQAAATVDAQVGGRRLSDSDERMLLLRHRAGDPQAFAALVAAYRASVYGYLSRCGVEPCERDDLFQEIFLKIHRAASSYQDHRPAHPWIFTIVCNTVRNHLRQRRVRQLVFTDSDETPDTADLRPDGERRAAARETARFLDRRIRALPLAQRQVMLLAAVERLPLKEVAEALAMPLGTVKTHLRRARLRLARELARRSGPHEATS